MAALNFSIGEFPFLQLADYYIVAKTANGFQILLESTILIRFYDLLLS